MTIYDRKQLFWLYSYVLFGQDNCRAMVLKLSGTMNPLQILTNDVHPLPKIISTFGPLRHNSR
jgi:hypothetical protein